MYLTSPSTAIACGRERTPSEIHSAIMSNPQCHQSIVLYLTLFGLSTSPSCWLGSEDNPLPFSTSFGCVGDVSFESVLGIRWRDAFELVLGVRWHEDSTKPFPLPDASIGGRMLIFKS
jgi:hypothetical protein